MKTLVQTETEFYHAAENICAEKNPFSKAALADTLIEKQVLVIQRIFKEIREIKNKLAGRV